MACCLVQTELAPPAAAQLTRAFKSLKTLTEADAIKLASESSGILIKNLSLEAANVLQRALQAEGVPTVVMDAARLPRLPDAKILRRMEFQTEALLIYDVIGRSVAAPWGDIVLVSAGAVRHQGMVTTRTEEKVRAYDPIRGIHSKVVTDVRHKVEENTSFILDIFLAGGVARHQIEAAAFMFKHCFDRPDLDPPRKLGLLIQMLCERAPAAVLNRGAIALRDGQLASAAYASKAAWADESTWLLWRMANHG
ncbi:MAG: hypothetical protein ACYDH9_22530 [Limisphaerales bacterium]